LVRLLFRETRHLAQIDDAERGPSTAATWAIRCTTGLLINAVIASIHWVQRLDTATDESMRATMPSEMAISEQ